MMKSSWMRWAGHVAGTGEEMTAYRILMRKPEGKRLLGGPRRRRGIMLKWILDQ
jgi:hypothetical protein